MTDREAAAIVTVDSADTMYKPENLFPEGVVFNCSRKCNSECYFDEICPETKAALQRAERTGENEVQKMRQGN